MSIPPCADECTAVLMERWQAVCADQGLEEIEVHVSHLPLLVPSQYVDLEMSCPHGVTWHVQPTTEQMAKWAEEGTL